MPSTTVWNAVAIAIATGVVTVAGGSLALHFRSAIALILAFSAGAIIGVALFDLLPEALELAQAMRGGLAVSAATAAGFALYFAADRRSVLGKRSRTHRHFGPAALTLHSALDGVGIGLAFHVSTASGLIVAAGVIAHDLVDGANTVVLSLSAGAPVGTARNWLIADAIAPFAGMILASAATIPPFGLAIALALFAGFFLYIGASQILARRPTRAWPSTFAATAAGLAFVYIVVVLAS